MNDDEDRDAILARRARFIAAALAGIAVTGSLAASCGDDVENPSSAASAEGAGGQPQPCLSPRGPTGEGGAGAMGAGGSGDGGAAGAGGNDGGGGGQGGASAGGAAGTGGQGGAMPCLAPPPRR